MLDHRAAAGGLVRRPGECTVWVVYGGQPDGSIQDLQCRTSGGRGSRATRYLVSVKRSTAVLRER